MIFCMYNVLTTCHAMLVASYDTVVLLSRPYLTKPNMEFKFQKRRGIGNVITTLIILIASVILGAGVIFFGGSMFQTNTQSESVKVTNVHSWVSPTTGANVTAFAVQNVGSKPISINSISFRGLPVAQANWYSCTPGTGGGGGAGGCGSSQNVNTELIRDYTPASVVLADSAVAYTFNAGPVSLTQGQATIVYVLNAGSITPIDAGNTYALQIQAGQAQSVIQVQVVSQT